MASLDTKTLIFYGFAFVTVLSSVLALYEGTIGAWEIRERYLSNSDESLWDSARFGIIAVGAVGALTLVMTWLTGRPARNRLVGVLAVLFIGCMLIAAANWSSVRSSTTSCSGLGSSAVCASAPIT